MKVLYRFTLPVLVTWLALGFGHQTLAGDEAYLNTISDPRPADGIYPIRIDLIDGKTPLGTMGGRANIPVKAGTHTFVVWMNLKNRWLDNVALPPDNKWGMEFKYDLQAGVTYILAGRALAANERKEGGPLWEPIVYEAHGKGVKYRYGEDDESKKDE